MEDVMSVCGVEDWGGRASSVLRETVSQRVAAEYSRCLVEASAAGGEEGEEDLTSFQATIVACRG
jgi:hypothetical protein